MSVLEIGKKPAISSTPFSVYSVDSAFMEDIGFSEVCEVGMTAAMQPMLDYLQLSASHCIVS